MTAKRFKRLRQTPYFHAASVLTRLQWHDTELIRKHRLRAPNVADKQVADWNDLLVLLTFNIAYDMSIFPRERHRVNLAGCYLFLACTGCRPAEIVDKLRRRLRAKSFDQE